MADITFIWSRLTRPALALRHAAPWARKISATSSAGRDMTAGRYADGWCFLLFLDFLRDCDSRSSGLSTPAIMAAATRVYRAVVSNLSWPKSAWMILISVPRSSRWVAKLWRSACSVTPFLIPAASAASWKRRLSWQVVIGFFVGVVWV